MDHGFEEGVAGLDVGHQQDVGAPGHGALDALDLGGVWRHGKIERERALDDGAVDFTGLRAPGDFQGLQAAGHAGERCFGRRKNRQPRQFLAQGVVQGYGVAGDTKPLFRRGRNVDRRVGDRESPRSSRDRHVEHVRETLFGPQAVVAVDYRAHQSVGVDLSLHQTLHQAAPRQLDTAARDLRLVRGGDDAHAIEVPADVTCCLSHPIGVTDQPRLDQSA